MADADEKKGEENPKAQESNEESPGKSVLPWIIMAIVVVVCAGAGFGLCRLLAGSDTDKSTDSPQENSSTQDAKSQSNPEANLGDGKTWYHPLEPIATNLNEPGSTRYIRVALTLEISSEVKQDEGKKLLEQKNPILTNLLNIYFKGLSLEDIRTDKDMRRIQYQILDALNEELFPDAKPQIKKILFKEFAIQ
jgi:flagellar basal body-associated protein FliL